MSRTDPAAIRRVGAEPTSPLRVLVLAPHPYFIDRGTPIDLGLVLRGFSLRGDQVDVVCYAEGKDVDLPGVTLHRIPDYPAFRNMRPGFSPRKLIADVWLYRIARDLLKRRRYDVIHAGEEAVFIALWFQKRYGVPYVYDLDSSIAQQLVERMPWLRLFSGLFDSLEARAIREAAGCVPVCNALGDLCRARGARHVEVLHDITLLDESDLPSLHAEPTRELRDELGVGGPLAMYVGNLEPYQGVDLLLDAMIHLAGTPESAGSEPLHLVVVGGRADDIARARRRVEGTSAEARVTFLGPRPVSQLASLLLQADILVAPRIRGLNTPMKVFSYLHTGRCVLVTDLPTHTQVLDRNVCAMAAPDPVSFARELARLTGDRELRERLGAAGRDYVLEHHVFEAYRKRFDRFYDAVAARLREPIRTSRQSTPPTPRTTLESTG